MRIASASQGVRQAPGVNEAPGGLRRLIGSTAARVASWAGFEVRGDWWAPSFRMLFGATNSGAAVNENTAFNVAAVRACVNLRANLLAMLPLKLYQRTANGPEERRDHPLSRLLRRRVSSAQTSFSWRHAASVCFDIGGNAYTRIHRDPYFAPVELEWLKPVAVAPRYSDATRRMYYQLSGGAVLQDFEVLHVRNLSTDGRTGRSPLADLREAVGLALTAEEFTARSFANGNRRPGFFVPPINWKKEQAEAFRDEWQKLNAGASNAGRIQIISGGMEWKDAGFSNQDAELLMSRKFSVEEIARVYHLPLHLINSTEKSTTWGSGIEQLNQGLVDYTLAPLCANWEAELNTTLLTEQEQDEGYYLRFSVDALLRGSMESRARVYQIMRGIAAMDVNQIRALEDWELYPDGWAGDPRTPLNNQGGGGAQPAADPMHNDLEDPAATDPNRSRRHRP